MPSPRRTLALSLLCLPLLAGTASAYGYDRDKDPLLLAFQAAVRATRKGDLAEASRQVRAVRWQTQELKTQADLQVDYAPTLRAAHAAGTPPARTIQRWSNLLYLALLQKFHWNLSEKLGTYHKARARLESALAYYEVALAGNVKRLDRARRKANPKARSRHSDIMAQFAAAKTALGSPGLFGAGARPADLAAFRKAVVRIAGHLKVVFPTFVRPGTPKTSKTTKTSRPAKTSKTTKTGS